MSEDRGNTFLAFVLGGIVGAAVALLYAPAAGAETRRRLREGFDDAGDWTRDKYGDAVDTFGGGADRVKDIMEEKKEDLKAAYEAGKDAYYKGKERLFKKEEPV